MKRALLLYVILIVAAIQANSQCMQYEIPIAERIGGAAVIIEGKIISKTCFPAGKKGMIYSRSTIEVYKIFKGLGVRAPNIVEIITEGGIYENEQVRVTPDISLPIGESGLFFLQNHIKNDDFKGLEPYSWGQCFVRYDEQTGTPADIFKKYSSINSLYKNISAQLGNSARIIQPYNPQLNKQVDKSAQTLAPVITGFLPTITYAGVDSIVTIIGSGFGSSLTGQAAVAFANADDGGATMFNISPKDIVLWTDAEIQVKVPSDAGTGKIRVTSASGSQSTSISSITVYYNINNSTDINDIPRQVNLVDTNNKGGYTITFNENFITNLQAVDEFNAALRSWRCNTLVNIGTDKATSTIDCYNGKDGVNIVSFDNNCVLETGVLGVTYYYYSICNSIYVRLRGFDILLSKDANGKQWNYTPQFAPGGSRKDFQSVVLHELGHVHQLGHVISPSEVMHYALPGNVFTRTLSARDIAAGNHVMERSVETMPCGPKGMKKLTSSICDNPRVAPTAVFSATPVRGCVPLTVNFTNKSTDDATLLDWDFKNDDEIHSSLENPTYTYTTPGTYEAKLTVSNTQGTHSVINYIYVRSLPLVDAGKNLNVCIGSTVKLGGNPTAGGVSPFTYKWSPVDFLDNATSSNPILSFNSQKPVEYTVTVTDGNGCVNVKSVSISPLPALIANAGNDKSFCRDEKGVVIGGSPAALGGTPPYTFSWIPKTGLDSTSIANPTANPKFSTVYILTVKDATNTCQAGIDTVHVTVTSASSKPEITKQADTLFSTSATTYQWSRNTVILPGETKQFIVTTIPGQYTVTTTGSSPCPATSDMYILKSTAVPDPVEQTEILIFPNPTDGNIDIQLPFTGAKCRITNILGMVISEQIIYGKETKVSLLNYPAGMYYIHFTTGDNRTYIKVITKD